MLGRMNEYAAKINSYRDLVIWQKARAYAVATYRITGAFPKSEIYGLVSQMRRAAVSIPSNIAEGFNRGFKKERIQFLRIAYGSGAELETQLEIAKDLNYIATGDYENQTQ